MKKYLSLLFVLAGIFACQPHNPDPFINNDPPPDIGILPTWAENANIYEVNIRQYSEEGTFNAFKQHLPRLREMGVGILWLMPIYPIGEVKRKGTLGSYYSVKDYKAVNPEHGTMEDFKSLVNEAHGLGMKIILDWVPNHTAWDHAWITQHPDWYTYDNDTITHPLDPNSGNPTGWTDVADLNYDNKDMRAAMIDALGFWIDEAGIDGYRCDVAGFVPNDFWNEAITALNQKKQVFMLAEWYDIPEHFDNGFHMNYSWPFKDIIRDIAQGHKQAEAIWEFYEHQEAMFPEQAIHMYFTTNHDENSWHNFPAILGDAQQALAVLSHTFDGMPLIYSGQESGLPRALSFFDKDQIDWGNFEHKDFYKKLNILKYDNNALANGMFGGKPQRIDTGNENVLGFFREKDGHRVEVFINLSSQAQSIAKPASDASPYMQEGLNVSDTHYAFAPWGYSIHSLQ
jgi:glycosidase